jgi:hypothetical protein
MNSMEFTVRQVRNTLNRAINDPKIMALLTPRGYGFEQLQEGLALCDVVQNSLEAHGSTRLSKANITQTFNENWQNVKYYYHLDVQAARFAFKKNEGSSYFLQLAGKRFTSFDKWYVQAHEFYNGLRNQPELQSAVEKLGLTAERVTLGIQRLNELDAMHSQQQMQQDSATNTSRQRREAFAALNQWVYSFRRYARLALAATPEHLKTLGLESISAKAPKKVEMIKAELPVHNMMSAQQAV